MQTPGLYLSPPHTLYQNAYHAAFSGPQDHELKKQYLALLPPQQIIEICLNFELHVPPYVKSTIWPPDINAAITALRKSSQHVVDPLLSQSSSKPDGDGVSPATSLDQSTSSTKPVQLAELPGEPPPPDNPPPASASSTQTLPPPLTEQAKETPLQVLAKAPPQQPPYSHHPYGYPPAQSAYPHMPYYQQHPGYLPYPSYPPYLQMAGYPPTPGYIPPPSNPPFAGASLTQPPQPPDPYSGNTHSIDDLPSYEEMIAEALLDSGDPDGCVPKDLFAWMAARYPLQSNFRPSASQALQKAFKRGRFIKSAGGKYRLNATWEGGNTSRRTTRRPQTHHQSVAPPAQPGSPFTHVPLVHHHQQQLPTLGRPFHPQPYGYPYQQPPAGFPGHPPESQSHMLAPQSAQTSALTASTSESRPLPQIDGHIDNPYEAAQNILKAINFGTLLQLPAEGKTREETGTDRSLVATDDAIHVTPVPTTTQVEMTENQETSKNSRAELQAHLALLAAQLTELAQMGDENSAVPYPVSRSLTHVQPRSVLAVQNTPPAGGVSPSVPDRPPSTSPHVAVTAEPREEEEEDSGNDMEEVI